MRLGIFARTFSRPTVSEVLDAVLASGLRIIQFNFSCCGLPTLPEHIDEELLKSLRKELLQREMTVAAVSGTFNLIHPVLEERRRGLQRLAVLAHACRALD